MIDAVRKFWEFIIIVEALTFLEICSTWFELLQVKFRNILGEIQSFIYFWRRRFKSWHSAAIYKLSGLLHWCLLRSLFQVGLDCDYVSLWDSVYSDSSGLVRTQCHSLLAAQTICRFCLPHRNNLSLLSFLSYQGYLPTSVLIPFKISASCRFRVLWILHCSSKLLVFPLIGNEENEKWIDQIKDELSWAINPR